MLDSVAISSNPKSPKIGRPEIQARAGGFDIVRGNAKCGREAASLPELRLMRLGVNRMRGA